LKGLILTGIPASKEGEKGILLDRGDFTIPTLIQTGVFHIDWAENIDDKIKMRTNRDHLNKFIEPLTSLEVIS
jgi:hypothetical protein